MDKMCELAKAVSDLKRLLEDNINIKFLKNKEAKKNNYRIEVEK